MTEGASTKLFRAFLAAQTRSEKLCKARSALPPGTSRARITTANARWARAAEERDRARAALDDWRASHD